MSRHWGLLITACLFMVMVEGDDDLLDLAVDTFDDQYRGCRDTMEEQLRRRGVLEAEMSTNKMLRRSWRDAQKLWDMKVKGLVEDDLPEGFRDHHGVAVVAYTGFVRDVFTKALTSAGRSYRAYMEDFHFKYLHFYLTVALQLLHKECWGGPSYRGYDHALYWLPPGASPRLRIGHFLHTYANYSVAYEMGNASFLTVQSCSGVPVHRFSEYPHEEEVVYPGYEVFTVSQDLQETNGFLLVGTGKWCSNFNCAFIQGENSKGSVEDCINADDVILSKRGDQNGNMTMGISNSGSSVGHGGAALLGLVTAAVAALFL